MAYVEQDNALLVFYEDLMREVKGEMAALEEKNGKFSPVFLKRVEHIKDEMEFERRLIEEVSLPARLILEHFSYFLDEADEIVGFSYGNITSGHGRLHKMNIADWGTISLTIGDSEIAWRDSDVSYLFYPDKVTIRAKDSLKDNDINFTFKHNFNHTSSLLSRFQAVKDDKKTAYWHEKLMLD